jgi:hypothetical protein
MRYLRLVVTGFLVVSTWVPAAAQGLPLKNGRPAVASVAGNAIYLDELVRDAGPSADRARLRQGLGTARDFELLSRLVNIKLVMQEAAPMGLDETPEIQRQVEVTSREILREVHFERLVKGVTPDPAAVEKLFRDMVREWRTSSLLFQDEAAARRAHMEIANGAPFADVAARALAAKAARAEGADAFHPKKDYLPPIAAALSKLTAGQLGPLICLQAGCVVFTVVDIRYPENPAARAEARRQVLDQQQLVIMKAHEQKLRKQSAVVKTAVLKGVNYEAEKPGIDALMKDKRVVADIKGVPPVTVGDLTDYLRFQFFHGSDRDSQRRRMNEKKEEALDAMVGRRLLNAEAIRMGIDKTTEYRDRTTGYRESLVFDAFVQKVVAPDSKMREAEVKGYYDGHVKEYSSPEMMRIRSLAFTGRPAAEKAVKQLREGADFGWLAANASGQVGRGAPGLLAFDGQPFMTTSMPEGLQKAVVGAKANDVRLWASPQGHYYALAIQQVVAPKPRPYEEVRDEIAKKLYAEKLKKNIEEYAAKLQARSKVEIYLKKVQ